MHFTKYGPHPKAWEKWKNGLDCSILHYLKIIFPGGMPQYPPNALICSAFLALAAASLSSRNVWSRLLKQLMFSWTFWLNWRILSQPVLSRRLTPSDFLLTITDPCYRNQKLSNSQINMAMEFLRRCMNLVSSHFLNSAFKPSFSNNKCSCLEYWKCLSTYLVEVSNPSTKISNLLHIRC